MDNITSVEESIRSLWEATRSEEWSVDSSESRAESQAPVDSEEDTAEEKEISAVFSDLEISTMAAPRGQRLRVEGFSSPMASSALFDGFQLYLSTTQEVTEEDISDQENEDLMITTTATSTPTPTKPLTEGCTSASPRFATFTPSPTTNVSSPRFAFNSMNHPTPIINNRTKSVTWASTPLGRFSS